jgi:hypothetical protein
MVARECVSRNGARRLGEGLVEGRRAAARRG